ncbi:endoribonuclease Dcr-2 [Cochliomyia hominivorax]
MSEDKEMKSFQPRQYQLELLNYVCKRNSIIYLPTGSGKTLIAILALKHFSSELQQTINNGGKRAMFICNTVELARQQYRHIKNTTNFKVGLYIGEREVDNWCRRQWDYEIENNQVLVGTAQIFLDIVNQNLIKISDLSIVIIDECHNATRRHPMHEFLAAFQYCDQSKHPRVIGLTGVLIKGNKLGQVVSEMEKLEATFRGNIVTICDTEKMKNVMIYSTKPSEEMVTFSNICHKFRIEHEVLTIIKKCKTTIDNYDIGNIPPKMSKNLATLREPNKKNAIKNLLSDFEYQMNDLGLYAASIAIMSLIIEYEIKKRQAETITLRNLYRYVIQCCERIRHIIVKELKSFLDEEIVNENSRDDKYHTIEVINNYSTPKLLSLFEHMKRKFKGKKADEIACLVFVERRYTAKCLYYVLKNYMSHEPELRNIIRPQFMVGKNNILHSIENHLDTEWNKSAINDFRAKQCNIIICSNVLEEGIDVQACNYVFAFDPLKTFNSYIQTKGRARSVNSFYSIFCPESDKMETLKKIQTYRITHEQIKTFLKDRTLDRDDPAEEEIAKQFVEFIPPFIIPSGARLTAASALTLLYRYCQTLPWDHYGASQPFFNKLPPNKEGKFAVSLCLPLQSTVRETIYSDYYRTIKECKISAAFKACVKLYENGEFNKSLLPILKTELIVKVSEELFRHWKKYKDDITKETVGKQLKRVYEKQCPDELNNSLPRLGEKAYAYSINFTTDFEINSYNEHIVNYLGSKSTYAILLRKRLPSLAKMPLFMSQGKLHVEISENPIECLISNQEQINELKHFHTMLFRELLRLWKEFLVIDHRNEDNSYFIIPLDERNTIDWQLIKKFQHLNPCRKYTTTERQNAQYRPEDYINKVVTKWYDEIQCESFVVTKVHQELTPMSPFDNNQYGSYADFYASRYSLNIVNKQQFLLEVKSLTKRRNFFNNASNKSTEKKKDLNKTILIPELCHNYKYPADLWLKALFLPTILHRVYYMLHAESLRKCINNYLNLDKYFKNYKPKPLIIDESLKRVLDDDGNLIKKKSHAKRVHSLPTVKQSTNYQVHMLDDDQTIWKKYLEPKDFTRQIEETYPIEIDYYYKFIMNLIPDVEKLRINEEKEYAKTQFEMTNAAIENVSEVSNISGAVNQLAIMDSSPVGKHIEIEMLKRNFEPDHCLKSAEQYEFLAAITAACVNDVFDMERFELLGDAFLKFSSSLYLTNKYTKWHEGHLTLIKSRMVSNRNLLYCMMNTNICGKICASFFNPNTGWLPPLANLPVNLLQMLKKNLPANSVLSPSDFYSLELSEDEIFSGICASEKLESFSQACKRNQTLQEGNIEIEPENDMNIFINRDVLRDKIIADTLEALLGVCVKNYGIHRSFRMLEFFGIWQSENKDSSQNGLLDLKLSGLNLRTDISQKEIDCHLLNYEYLEKNLNYTFRDRAYLLQALTHPSYPTNRVTGCYQELEFIGDAILDMLVTSYIFEKNEHMNPGKMTDLRMALVNNITLGCICVRHKFHLFLLYENSILSEAIKIFADFQQTQNNRVTDQVKILMEEENDSINPFNDIFNDTTDDDNNSDMDDSVEYDTTNNTNADKCNASNAEVSDKKTYNIAKNVDVPKALGDVVEALIAAVYLDCRDLNKTWEVIYHLMKIELDEFSRNIPIDPVRKLEEHKQAKPKYSKPVIDNKDVMVECYFNCLDKLFTTIGFGCNSKQAKKAAAKQALQILAKYSN